MSEPVTTAIVTVVKYAGIALSVKSAIEGLRDGNFLQAVVGAVGAYYGVTSIGSQATANTAVNATKGAAADTASNAATGGGANLVENQAADILGTAAESATKEAAESTTGQMLEAAANGTSATAEAPSFTNMLAQDSAKAAGQTGTGLISEASMNVVPEMAMAPEQGGGFVSGVQEFGGKIKQGLEGTGGWIKKNPDIAQVGGSILQSYAEQKAKDDRYKRYLKELDARRNRMGATPDSYVNNYYQTSRGGA